MRNTTLTHDQRELAELISDISEEQYCAGWMHDIEFDLWAQIHGDAPYRIYEIAEHEKAALRDAALRLDGWIAWSKEAGCEVFVPMAEWLELFKNWDRGAFY